MHLGIQHHLHKLPYLYTVYTLERFDVEQIRSTVHNGVQKIGLQPSIGNSPDHVTIDETMIELTDQRYWRYAAVDPETNEFRHARPFPTRSTAVTSIVLSEPTEKYDVSDTVFLVDSAPWLQVAHHRHELRFRYERHGNRNAVKRVFQGIKLRTYLFGNCFRNADSKTAETWLQNFSYSGIGSSEQCRWRL